MPRELGALPAPDPDTVRGVAQRILARAEFQQAPQSPIDRLRHWIATQIARAVAAGLSGRATVLGVILLILIAGLVVVLAVRFSRSLQRDARRGQVVVGLPGRAPAEWWAEAAACDARGDHRGALRARYRALVAELAVRRLIDEVPGRTTGEYRAAVAVALPDAADPFGGATELFEAAFYGDRATGPTDSAALTALADRVLVHAR